MRTTFQFLILTLLTCMVPSAASGARSTQAGRESAYNQKGLEYFKEGFYQRLPKGQQREADQAFDLATVEFRNAIAVKPDFVEAHRNLARLYFVRKRFSEAAESYGNVTRLVPEISMPMCRSRSRTSKWSDSTKLFASLSWRKPRQTIRRQSKSSKAMFRRSEDESSVPDHPG